AGELGHPATVLVRGPARIGLVDPSELRAPDRQRPRGALTAGPEVGVDDGRVRFCREIGGPDRGLSTVGAPARGLAILAAEPRRVPTWAVPDIPPRAAPDQSAQRRDRRRRGSRPCTPPPATACFAHMDVKLQLTNDMMISSCHYPRVNGPCTRSRPTSSRGSLIRSASASSSCSPPPPR